MKNDEITYTQSDSLLHDAQQIIETAQNFAYRTVNVAMVQRNWLLGKRIAEEELQGKERAEYGREMLQKLSMQLTNIYGNGFTISNLYAFIEFYKAFPNIFHAVSVKSENNILHSPNVKSSVEILDSLSPKLQIQNLVSVSPKSFSLLTWTHYRTLLQVKDPEARDWYMIKLVV